MDIGKSFTFMFEDPAWLRKLGIGTLVTLVGFVLSPVLIGLLPLVIVYGYTLAVTANVRAGNPRPLPEWENNWGDYFSRGAKLFVVFLVWSLPMILLILPPVILGSLWAQNNSGAEGLGVALMVCGYCLMFIYAIALTVISPAIYVRLAETNQLSAGFQVGELWAFTRAHIGNIIIAVILTWVAGFLSAIIAFAGLIALLIGVIVTVPFAILWQMLVQAHLFGQVAPRTTTYLEAPNLGTGF